MPAIIDLSGHKRVSEPIILVREMFDASEDVLSWAQTQSEHVKQHGGAMKLFRSGIHFISLASIIFVVLLCISNWSSYGAYARAIILPGALKEEQVAIEGSISDAAVTLSDVDERKRAQIQKVLKSRLEKGQIKTQNLGVGYFDQDVTQIPVAIDIAPYEDRILIPKIGKNIPLVNVEHHDATNSTEWENIFMKELENGVVKYPGSADPGELGNSFIFGHSSNYPWAKGEYNDVFALLNELQNGDEIIVYFHQKKYTYVVREKTIVKPGHVASLGSNDTRAELTLMTCWPIGTTLKRLLVTTVLRDTSDT